MDSQKKTTTLFSYSLGEDPNLAMLFIGMCLCGIGCIIQTLNMLKAYKVLHPEYDDKLDILKAIISIWGLIELDIALTNEEKQANINPNSQLVLLLASLVCCCSFIVWPLAICAQMKRLNALAAAKGL